jgi:hypothetical protein
MKAESEINVKIGKKPYRIPAGKEVPAEVERFWTAKQKEDLRKGGMISEIGKEISNKPVKAEKKDIEEGKK